MTESYKAVKVVPHKDTHLLILVTSNATIPCSEIVLMTPDDLSAIFVLGRNPQTGNIRWMPGDANGTMWFELTEEKVVVLIADEERIALLEIDEQGDWIVNVINQRARVRYRAPHTDSPPAHA